MAILTLLALAMAVCLGLWLVGATLRGTSPGAKLRAGHGLLALLGVGLTVATAFRMAEPPGVALWMLGAAFVAGMVLWLFWDPLRSLRASVIALHGLLGLVAFFLVADWLLSALRLAQR